MKFNSVGERFEAIAAAYKDNIAVDSDQKRLTYQELNDLANRVATSLLSLGVSKGEIVIFLMARSVDLVVSILAITKIGATYVPVYSGASPKDLRHILKETGADVVITDDAGDQSPFSGLRVIVYDELNLSSVIDSSSVEIERSSEDCFYIMYTSGSTGTPKGVMVPDRGVLRLVVDSDYIDITSSDAIYMTADFSFDGSTFELWGALLNGAKVIIDGAHFDPNRFAKTVLEKNATIVWITSGLFHILGANKPQIFKPLKVLLSGGDVLNGSVIRSILKSCPDLKIINGYGPIENTTFTSCYPMTAQNPPGDNVPIGYSIKGTNIYVLDENLRPVSDGESGIMYVSGDGVALGYLGRKNDKSFFYDANICDGLIYNTGDIVKQQNGLLEFIGREDNLYKIRGHRVSLEFVTECFYKLKYVENALVYAKKDISDNNTLHAKITTTKNNIHPKEVKDEISEMLPNYMIPDFIEVLDSMTLNKNGKLDRTILSRSM